MLVPLVPGRGFEPRSPVLQTGAVTRSAFRAVFGADAGNRNRAFGVALRNSTFELHPRVHSVFERKPFPDLIRDGYRFASRKRVNSNLVGSGENRTSGRKGTAFTAPRRHQPSLWALPVMSLRPAKTCPPQRKKAARLFTHSRAAGTSAVGRSFWRKVKESNHQRFRWPGFQDRLLAAERHLPLNWPSRGDSNTRPHGPEPCALVRLSYATIGMILEKCAAGFRTRIMPNEDWSGREDSNLRSRASEARALAGLSYTLGDWRPVGVSIPSHRIDSAAATPAASRALGA